MIYKLTCKFNNDQWRKEMHKRSIIVLSALILLASSLAAAVDLPQPEVIDKPIFKVNDSWTYRINNRARNGETKERRYILSIIRTSSNGILQSVRAVDSSLPPIEKLVGADFSQVDSINGKEVVVHKPFDFPMEIGKQWEISYEKTNPTKSVKKHTVKLNYKGIGWEEVTVPAGKFQAFKVEVEGTWQNEFNPTPLSAGSVSQVDQNGATIVMKNQKPTVPAPVIGRMFRSYWYVPAIKRDVKSIEEEFTTDGGLASRNTWELESFILDGQGNK
jgi:hypothetical protein